jgi:polyvinyl alcohol dehydrogenase (cytochrome)
LSDALIAIHYETGELVWSHQYTRDDVFVTAKRCDSGGACPNDFDIGASPNLFVAAGRDAVGVGSKAGIYKALDRESGEVIWSRQLNTGSSGGGVMTTAAVGDGVVFVSANEWLVYQFPLKGGHSPNDTSRTFALDADTGATLWERPMIAPGIGHLTLANGVLYQGLVDGHGVALAASEGNVLWQYDLGHDLACGFSVVDGVLYGGSGGSWLAPSTRPGGSLFAFSAD